MFFRIEKYERTRDTITEVNCYKKKKKLFITIKSHFPALVIGKKGLLVNKIKEHLKKEFTEYKEIVINIESCRLWWFKR